MYSEQQYVNLYQQVRQLIISHSSDVMNAIRDQAYEDFKAQGFPTKKVERYKYTDIPSLFEPDYGLNIQRLTIPVDPYQAFRCDVPNLSTLLYFVVNDGFYNQALPKSHLPEGVKVCSLKEMSEEREKLSEGIRRMISEKEALSEQIHALDKECVRLHNRKERLQEDVDSRVAYMWEEYEITLSDAKALRDESLTDIAALKKGITECKARIKALGSVNVDAVEEYRELMERYTFLKSQHDDLTEAAASLEKIIAELDASMRKQFAEQFGKIRDEFDKVFKIMFGGGTGRLELLDDKDILEAGVRVIAQPPGKKLQNMNALSGGEKALTAIALLFAIQNLKPSPFCLLDEIEAALDESNIVRFAEYLHKLTKYTQFIVITHRRGTMEEADRLYGITMQEKGVSALVSVDLIDEEELA